MAAYTNKTIFLDHIIQDVDKSLVEPRWIAWDVDYFGICW